MKIRTIGALLCGGLLLLATATGAFADPRHKSGKTQPTPAASKRGYGIYLIGAVVLGKKKQSANARATTVKSSKSNTSERMGGGPGHGTARATTVKSSKSNTSD
jgi:hypothetical protein